MKVTCVKFDKLVEAERRRRPHALPHLQRIAAADESLAGVYSLIFQASAPGCRAGWAAAKAGWASHAALMRRRWTRPLTSAAKRAAEKSCGTRQISARVG